MTTSDFHWQLCRISAYIVRHPLWSLIHLIGIITVIFLLYRFL